MKGFKKIEGLGQIPVYWGAKKLVDLFKISNGYTPSTKNLAFWRGLKRGLK